MANKPRKKYKPRKRPPIKSKSTKAAKKKKKGALKRTADAAGWWQRCRSEVVRYYKTVKEKENLDKQFIKAQTTAVYNELKKLAAGTPRKKITDGLFAIIVGQIDQILKTPNIILQDPDKFLPDGLGFDYFELDYHFRQYRQELKKFNEIVVDCSKMMDRKPDVGTAPEEINTTEIVREINHLVDRMSHGKKIVSGDFYFVILTSKDKKQRVYELTKEEPEELMYHERLEGEEPPGKKGGKKTTPAEPEVKKEEPKFPPPLTEPGKKEPETTTTRSALDEVLIKQAEERFTIEKLGMKKKEYREDIGFNDKRIKRLNKLINVYKPIGVDFSKEKAERDELEAMNKDLMRRIKDINDKLDKI